MNDGFSLSDFLSTAGNAYSAYTNGRATTDAAKLNQATAAQTAALVAQNAASHAQLKTYLIYGFIAVAGLFAVALLFKSLKK